MIGPISSILLDDGASSINYPLSAIQTPTIGTSNSNATPITNDQDRPVHFLNDFNAFQLQNSAATPHFFDQQTYRHQQQYPIASMSDLSENKYESSSVYDGLNAGEQQKISTKNLSKWFDFNPISSNLLCLFLNWRNHNSQK